MLLSTFGSVGSDSTTLLDPNPQLWLIDMLKTTAWEHSSPQICRTKEKKCQNYLKRFKDIDIARRGFPKFFAV